MFGKSKRSGGCKSEWPDNVRDDIRDDTFHEREDISDRRSGII